MQIFLMFEQEKYGGPKEKAREKVAQVRTSRRSMGALYQTPADPRHHLIFTIAGSHLVVGAVA
jgi:hypothetical protein